MVLFLMGSFTFLAGWPPSQQPTPPCLCLCLSVSICVYVCSSHTCCRFLLSLRASLSSLSLCSRELSLLWPFLTPPCECHICFLQGPWHRSTSKTCCLKVQKKSCFIMWYIIYRSTSPINDKWYLMQVVTSILICISHNKCLHIALKIIFTVPMFSNFNWMCKNSTIYTYCVTKNEILKCLSE